MAFLLDNVVPWGRTRDEYLKMFSLSENNLSKKIASFGDGPASFSTISLLVDKNNCLFVIYYKRKK